MRGKKILYLPKQAQHAIRRIVSSENMSTSHWQRKCGPAMGKSDDSSAAVKQAEIHFATGRAAVTAERNDASCQVA